MSAIRKERKAYDSYATNLTDKNHKQQQMPKYFKSFELFFELQNYPNFTLCCLVHYQGISYK
jgi:hypothetical protein